MRLSLSNHFFAVSHYQFQKYCDDFKRALEHTMASPFNVRVSGYSAPIEYITIDDKQLSEMCYARNAEIRLFNSVLPGNVSKNMWSAAKYVDVLLKPLDPSTAPNYAFATLQFKGHKGRTATFYAQGKDTDGQSLKELMCHRYPDRIVGDGFGEHADSNTLMRGMMRVNPSGAISFLSHGYHPATHAADIVQGIADRTGQTVRTITPGLRL